MVRAMKAWTTLASAEGLEGQQLVLQERDGVFVVRSGGRELMSSAHHHSEEVMSRIGLEAVRASRPVVLIGGLGLGYTVRAALEVLPRGGRVVVAEISPAVVEWNRTFVADLAGRPLEDPRVEVVVEDVAEVIRRQRAGFDCILLDIDNGPSAVTAQRNQRLFELTGIASIIGALRPGGVVVIWSAGPDAKLQKLLGQAGLQVHVERSAARAGTAATPHVLFVGKLSAGPQRSGRRSA